MADIDWSQFSTEPPPAAAPDSGGIDWSQFSPAPPGVDVGPPRANDFSNVEAGARQNMHPSVGTLGRWFSGAPSQPEPYDREAEIQQGVHEFAGNLGSAVQGAREDYQYPQEYYTPDHATSMSELITGPQPHAKHRVGGAEGFIRGLAADLGEFGDSALAATPVGFAERVAGAITGQQAPGNAATEAARLHPETEQYTGARAELTGELGHNIVSNLLPLEGMFAGAGKFIFRAEKTAAEAAHEAALIGELGPEAQGAATANEIAAQAVERRPPQQPQQGDITVTPEMRQPAAAITPEQEARDVSAAAMDASARPGAGEAQGLPSGEPVPVPAEGPPLAAVAERPPGDARAGVAAPEPLYHASLSPDIQSFDVARSGTQSDTGVLGRAAAYATGDERLAPFYLGPKKDQGTLYKLEHQLKNPAEFDSPQAAIEWQGERGTDSPEAAERVRQKYLSAGYDGAVIRNPKTGKVMEAAIFDPNAVKITGKRPIKAPLEVPRQQDLSLPNESLQPMFHDAHAEQPLLRYVPRDVHAGVAENAPAYAGAASKGQRAQLRQHVPAAGEADAGAVQGLRGASSGEAPRGLREAARGDVAVSPVSPREARGVEENANARTLRSDQGESGAAQPERAGVGREDLGRKNLQRDAQAGQSEPEQLRPAGTRPERNAEPIPAESLTGVSHAKVAEERTAKGLDELHYELRRRFGEVHERARAALEKDPNAGRALVQSVIDKPRPLSAEESVTMALDRARLKNETDRAYADAADAMDRGDVNAEADARARLKLADEEMAKHDRASKASGYEGGLGLAARQILVKRDYSLAEIRQRARVAAGVAVSEKTEKRLADLATQIAEKDKRIAELERSRVNAPKEPVARAVVRKADAEFKELSKQLKSVAQIICGV